MKIGIIGAGNLGSVLAVKFSLNNDVYVYKNNSSQLSLYKKNMQVYCEDTGKFYSGDILKFTSDLKELVDFSEYIFITFPPFMFESLADELIPLLSRGKHLVFVPGGGASEIYFKEALTKGVTITGLQRVHAVARIVKIGELVRESGIRKSLRIASIPTNYNIEAANVLSDLFEMPVECLGNYLNITLINSNPILHTSRLYSIFHDYPIRKKEYNNLPLFYEEWDVETSKLLVEMDNELFLILDRLRKHQLYVTEIIPITSHYDSVDEIGLTNKIKSIKAFKGLVTPSLETDNHKFIPDFCSRYFTADFPYGLEILIEFARITSTNCHKMEIVDEWYRTASNNKEEGFKLSKFGINSIEDLKQLYLFKF